MSILQLYLIQSQLIYNPLLSKKKWPNWKARGAKHLMGGEREVHQNAFLRKPRLKSFFQTCGSREKVFDSGGQQIQLFIKSWFES